MMSNPFVDAESGGGARDGTATRDFYGNDEYGGLQFTAPFDTCTVGQIRHQRTGTMMAHLRCVSTSLLAAGSRKDSIIDEPFGGTSLVHHQGRNARSAPPTTTLQIWKFVHAEPVPDGDMLLIDVTLKKEDYGAPGLLDYRTNMAMAMAGLTEKFGVARHKIVVGGEEGNQSKSAHVQQVIVNIIHHVKEGHQ